jgi:hypothetical protein
VYDENHLMFLKYHRRAVPPNEWFNASADVRLHPVEQFQREHKHTAYITRIQWRCSRPLCLLIGPPIDPRVEPSNCPSDCAVSSSIQLVISKGSNAAWFLSYHARQFRLCLNLSNRSQVDGRIHSSRSRAVQSKPVARHTIN